MIFSFFRQKKRDQAIEPLYGAIMAAALNPRIYTHFSVPDTFEGRFEAASLHFSLALRKLRQFPPPAGDVAQDLVDHFFDGLDSAMRQSGISDNALPKRIKKFAQGFYGRLESYNRALEPDAPPSQLAEVLERNLLEGGAAKGELVLYVRTLADHLDADNLKDLIENGGFFAKIHQKKDGQV